MITVFNFRSRYLLKVTTDTDRRGRFLGSLGLIDLVGIEVATRLVERAERAKMDKITCRLRRGLQFHFYVR